MPIPRKRPIGRNEGWNTRHLAMLLTGHDWQFLGREGWGQLSALPEDELRAAVADMSLCWNTYRHELREHTEGIYHPDAPWFQEYAGDPDRLIAELLADPMREQRMRWRAQIKAQNPHADAPTAVADSN